MSRKVRAVNVLDSSTGLFVPSAREDEGNKSRTYSGTSILDGHNLYPLLFSRRMEIESLPSAV